MGPTFLIAQSVLVLLGLLRPKWDRALAYVSGSLLILVAGFREGGFDYEQYVEKIVAIQNSSGESWTLRLLVAKDPLMLLIVDLCRVVSEEVRVVFVIMTLLAVVPKVVAARAFAFRESVFLGLYSILLAPGLEFAAMRGAVALGLLMLLMTRGSGTRGNWLLAVAAVSAHVSAAPSLAALLGKNFYDRVILVLLPLLIAVVAFLAAGVIALFPRAEDYENNVGTMNALLPPLLGYFGFVLTTLTARRETDSVLMRKLAWAASIGVGAALGFAAPAVTISTRFLEFGFGFLLMLLILRYRRASSHEMRLTWNGVGLLVCCFVLGVMNLMRSTWMPL